MRMGFYGALGVPDEAGGGPLLSPRPPLLSQAWERRGGVGAFPIPWLLSLLQAWERAISTTLTTTTRLRNRCQHTLGVIEHFLVIEPDNPIAIRFELRERGLDGQAFSGLEKAVDEALETIDDLRIRLGESQARCREMEELLRKFTQGEEEPSRLLSRLASLEEENVDLLDRIRRGREGADRLLARIRFLEEQA